MHATRHVAILILILAVPPLGHAVELRHLCRMTLQIEGGSVLVGTPHADHLQFVSAYGRLEVPVNRIQSLVASGDAETFTLTTVDGEVVRGAPDQRTLEVDTLMGTLDVPLQHLQSAAFTAPEVFGGHAYIPLDDPMTWAEAHAHATSLGGHLVVIDGALENQFLTDLMAGRGHASCWLGFSDEWAEGVFQWVDGSEGSFTNWSVSEPNNASPGEHHAQLYTSGSLAGAWNDCAASMQLPFVVELELG